MMFWEINLKLEDQPAEPDHKSEYVPGGITLFFSKECEHCKTLELFLNKHNLYAIFNITKKEVSRNKKNHAEMEKLYKKCIDPKRGLVVPFVSYNNKCYMGEEVLRMFKNRIWEIVKEKKQALRTLLNKTNLPLHIKEHQEHYKRILDTALNCCKE